MIVFCTSSIDTQYDWFFKYKLWLDWHKNKFDYGRDIKFIFINDGVQQGVHPELAFMQEVDFENLTIDSYDEDQSDFLIVNHPDKLGKLHFKGWSRSFFSAVRIAERLGEDKIIHIESDAFVLSNKLVQYLYDFKEGWEVLWCPKYQFPENAIQVICKDSFEEFKLQGRRFKDGIREGMIENLLPYKTVNKDFIGDRYGEVGLPFNNKMDYYCQYLDNLKKRG